MILPRYIKLPKGADMKYFLFFMLAFSLNFHAHAGLEAGSYVDDLVITNPASGDDPSQGDDHLRLIKKTVTQSFPAISGAVSSTHTELNILDGVTSSTAELNILDGVTADKDEINVLDGVTGGTVTASKALVVNGSSALDVLTITTLTAGATSVLGDGVTATTQTVFDNSTKVATTADISNASKSVFVAEERKTSGSPGGDFNSGAWRTRLLSDVAVNNISGASLSTNQITLPAGTYEIEAWANAGIVDLHATRLYNVTDDSVPISGSGEYTAITGMSGKSTLRGVITIAGTKVFELQHRCSLSRSSTGFGFHVGGSFAVEYEVFSNIKIKRIN
jgi:hypothetical protein